MAKKKEIKKRRLELVLSEDHWIFQIPEGERASVIRTILDIYSGGETSLQVARGLRPLIKKEFKKEIKKIEEELKEIKDLLKAEKLVIDNRPANEKKENQIDVKKYKAFLDTF